MLNDKYLIPALIIAVIITTAAPLYGMLIGGNATLLLLLSALNFPSWIGLWIAIENKPKATAREDYHRGSAEPIHSRLDGGSK